MRLTGYEEMFIVDINCSNIALWRVGATEDAAVVDTLKRKTVFTVVTPDGARFSGTVDSVRLPALEVDVDISRRLD